MKIKYAFFILLILSANSCQPISESDQEGIKKENAANRILKKVALQLKTETDLRPTGTMGQMHYDVGKLGLSFHYRKPVDIAEGRKLLIQAVNAMLKEVNQDEKIRPYLCRHPFLPRNIEIEIFLKAQDGRSVPAGALCVIDAQDGFLRYDVRGPEDHGFITVYKETFSEALERLADPSLPLASFKPDEEVSKEEVARLRKNIRMVGSDGVILHMDENGSWKKESK